MPTIAIAMPAYNAGEWIDATLETVLAQTRPADEVIVVDDGSSDDTAARARSHGDRVTVLNQENAGPPAAYNTAFAAATSDYVAMCPADDLWNPRKLEWQAASLEADPEIDVTFGQAEYFGMKHGLHPHPARAGRQLHDPFLREMYQGDRIPAPTAVVRRELHERLGRFDESLASEDYEFWLRALRSGAVFNYDPRVMVRLRQHESNTSGQALQMWEMNHQIRVAFAADVGDPALSRRLVARDLRAVARARFGLSNPGGARAAYNQSLRRRPSVEALVGSIALASPAVGRALARLNERRKSASRA